VKLSNNIMKIAKIAKKPPGNLHRVPRSAQWLPATLPQSDRQRTACCDDGAGGGLCVGEAAGRGGGLEILSRTTCCTARS